jgi:mRNA-degrading endonuclease RelE of RelBE toxin-antitoxin system
MTGEMKWGLVIGNRAERHLRRLTDPERHQIDAVFLEMCHNPYLGDVQFIKGSDGAFRRRTGDWRILYDLEPEHKVIVVTAVKHRSSNTY